MPWLEAFNLGTAAFRKGDLAEAARLMEEVREMRGGHDGPAEFYLERIKPLQAEGLPENWTGALELSSK
jgi:hypothetical protein